MNFLFPTKSNYLFTLSINSETVPKYGLNLFDLGTELASYDKKGYITIKASYFFKFGFKNSCEILKPIYISFLKGAINNMVNTLTNYISIFLSNNLMTMQTTSVVMIQ